MIKINCELPAMLLEQNNVLNDIDFVLFHLFDKYPLYRSYFTINSNLNSRTVIFDNSAYEYFVKGEELDLDNFAETIKVINPTYYILPDKLMDCRSTIEMVDKFINTYHDLPGRPMAVAQGNTIEEMLICIHHYNTLGIKAIAIPFHNSFFKDLGKKAEQNIKDVFLKYYSEITEDAEYAMGRVVFMEVCKNILKKFDYVHMLGSHCPVEKIFYNGVADSMDTGYPVKLGYEDIELFKETRKPSTIIDDFFWDELSDSQKSAICHNIQLFKEL